MSFGYIKFCVAHDEGWHHFHIATNVPRRSTSIILRGARQPSMGELAQIEIDFGQQEVDWLQKESWT